MGAWSEHRSQGTASVLHPTQQRMFLAQEQEGLVSALARSLQQTQ